MSNTLTLRKYFLWSSHWFCDYNYYNLLYEDIKINNYMQSIFYSLKYPSSNIVIKRYVHKLIVHSTFYILFWFKRHLNKKKLFSFFRKHKRYPINHFLLKKSVYFLSKRISNKLYFFILRYRRYKINYIKYFKINISTHERHVYKKYFIEYLLKDSSIIIENNFSIFKNINLVLDNEHNLLRSSAKKRSFNGYMRYKRDYLNIKRRYKFLMNKYALVFYRIKYMDIMKKHIYSVYRVSYDSLFKYVYEYSKIRYGFSLKYLSGKKNAFVPFQNIFDINKVKEMELIPFEENGITFKDYYHNLYSYLLSHLEYKSLKGSCIDKNFLFLFFMKEHKLNEELDHPMCNEFYFSWYLYMRKYHLHFFNKLHYYIKSCNINIEYRSIKILYYYHLMFYRIHKLRCFFKRTNKSYNAKFSLKRRFKNIIFTRERVFYVEIHFSKKVNLEKIALRYSQCYFTLIRFTNYINHLIFLVNINNVNIINYTGSFVKYLPFKEESSSSNTPNFFNIKKKHLYRGAFSTYRGTSYFNNQIRKYSTLLYKKKKKKTFRAYF